MRMYRILTAIIAFALLGLIPLVEVSSASAGVAESVKPTASDASSRALPRREMHDKVTQPSRHKLMFSGRVDPGHGPVFIEKKECRKGCHWKRFAKVKTDRDSRWKVRIFAPHRGEWFYRGYVKAYGGYALSRTGIWRTYTT